MNFGWWVRVTYDEDVSGQYPEFRVVNCVAEFKLTEGFFILIGHMDRVAVRA